MNILQQKYPNEKHVLVFDNAHTHAKRAEDALSAANMPHNPKHWGIPVPAHHTNGSIIYQPNGKPCMCNDWFPLSPDTAQKQQTWAQHVSWPPSHQVCLRQ